MHFHGREPGKGFVMHIGDLPAELDHLRSFEGFEGGYQKKKKTLLSISIDRRSSKLVLFN